MAAFRHMNCAGTALYPQILKCTVTMAHNLRLSRVDRNVEVTALHRTKYSEHLQPTKTVPISVLISECPD